MDNASKGILESAESACDSQGTNYYIKMAKEGKRLTLKEAVLAKCAECCCFYADGRRNCGIEHCPLYRWMPYKKHD
jgi:hypothetical protein